ncbi:MAG: 50S ribosomal protein L6 [candidate division WOR-3 bacterium]|nr:50S ribosomal protein L6 [candidate division WOR-3 bacterium]
MAKKLKPIIIPKGVNVETDSNNSLLRVKGPLGTLELNLHPLTIVEIKDNEISVLGKKSDVMRFIGTMRALIKNMIIGVTQGYEKKLEIRGTGYRAQKTKDGLQIFVGFSHPVDFPIPKEISVDLQQIPNPEDPKEQMTEITIKGIDKQLVGEVAAEIRAIRPPDVYQGKGIRYKGEYVRKKAGKRAVAAQA